ncbi:hypothetical protein HW130_24765 [Streptomyces sp. PKU-EA00015]|uniref:8-oxoguanine DNA glycosylase OGG fold protein n=1 Tax=Streptomyces sp. PKU-EA00015 TaxID=2748326 RepID=UPI0015A38E23|nr:hypothetical protein [Streptomyces sp. PKU-EA00015]NWF29431.1 hypothetical protein [Streptomyces sp. PKU-EA00015]
MAELPSDLIVPQRDDILGQAIPFDRERWLSHLPDAGWWPDELDACPRVGRWHRVDRRTVFHVADRARTAVGRRQLLVASLVWGTGTKARSVDRRARIFRESTAVEIDTRLASGLGLLQRRGAAPAYYTLNNDHHIPRLGAAFFTKVLYFAGHDQPVGRWRPLILDSVVARALRAADRGTRWPVRGWTTPQYTRYLSLTHDHARQAGVLPDQVEAALFDYGKRLT